jgi:hypothetical protein
MELRNAVISASAVWKRDVGGDINLVDVMFQAVRVGRAAGEAIPAELPERLVGVRLVEIVDRELIKGDLIRTLSSEELAGRAEATVRAIEAEGILAGHSAIVKYVVALFTWHGCIHMAKATRRAYRTAKGEEDYNLDLRWHAYDIIRQWWAETETLGNPWVKFGVGVARLVEQGRGNQPVEDWVPADSPYWSN